MRYPRTLAWASSQLLAYCFACGLLTTTSLGRVLDNFDGATKTDWTDFTFAPGAGSIVQQNGQIKFEVPAVAVQAAGPLFCASTKTSETFTLQEGRTLEFRVDVVEGGGDRSYAVLGFIPTSSGGPGALKGYSLSKSPTDVLLVKGINQYFIDDDKTAPPKQTNITLILNLKVQSGNVIIHGEVLDKDQNDAVIWERTMVDTPAADQMGTGTDNPAAPFLGTGNFVLFLYANYDPKNPATLEDPYRAVYDNAEVFVTDSVVLDDFNDNTKTGWSDFGFVPAPFGVPVEQNGQFTFELPGAVMAQVGQPIFSASTKTTPMFEVKEGERLEFQVDVIRGGAKDSFAVLGFIPSSGSVSELKGYSLAKSTTDVLVVKGIEQYFVADDGTTAELKQENITMVLSLTTRNGAVTIDCKVLDKEDNNAVIWHRRVVDTPAADLMEGGTDNPAAPYIGRGNFVLFLYADYSSSAPEDPYVAGFDNAIVSSAPQVGNTPPVITDISPVDRANFLAAPVQISFKATDDQPLVDSNIIVSVNGTNYTTTNGLVVMTSGDVKTATLSGLGAGLDYTVGIRVQDSNGEATTKTIYFDTFLPNLLALELEDFNYNGGQFIDAVKLVAEQSGDADSYSMQIGTLNVDYSDTRPGAAGFNNNPFRPDDNVRMSRSRDNARAKYTAAGGAEQGIYDYDVVDIDAGEWLNYTHTFPAGSYEVYLRQSIANLPTAESVLEKVTSDPTQENQTTQVLGSFLGTLTGFTYRNFPLTDASGQKKVVLRLDGKTTLRLRQITADTSDGARQMNYLLFVPVADAGPQRANVSAVEPAAGSTVDTVRPVIRATIQNRDTSVNTNTIKLEVNGQEVAATITPSGAGAVVSYLLQPLPPSGTTNQALVSFNDSDGTNVSTSWKFVLAYRSVDPALRVSGSGKDRGFNVRVVQAQAGQSTDNSLAFAESLLSPSTSLLVQYETNVMAPVINFSENGADTGIVDGSFGDDVLIPGLDPSYSTDDIAMEATAYLELPAGTYRFGANCDDGYKVQVVSSFTARDTPPLAFHNGGPANETYDFVVSQGGLYRFRMVWYERSGGAHVEWFQGNFDNTDRLLVNTNSTAAVKAYTSISTPLQFNAPVLSGGQLTISWTGSGTLEESSDLHTWTVVAGQPTGSYSVGVGTAAGAKFYRIKQ